MLNLLLIGGGEIKNGETFALDRNFVDSLKKENPKVLLILTAAEVWLPDISYEKSIRVVYEKQLNCLVDVLYLTDDANSLHIQDKLNWADGIYIGGGDTEYMMARWQKTGLDGLLKQNACAGKPIIGLSAGAICWFEQIIIGAGEKVIDGLGVLKGRVIPHWNKRKAAFLKTPLAQEDYIPLVECVGLKIVGDQITRLSANGQEAPYPKDETLPIVMLSAENKM